LSWARAASCIFSVALASGCSRCRDGTVFVDLTLAGAAQSADRLVVTVQLGAQRLSDDVVYAHQATYGLEIHFPTGYPTGKTVIVTITARQGDTDLATATGTIELDPGCTRLPLTLTAPADMTVPAPVADLTVADLAQPPPDLTFRLPLCSASTSLFCDSFEEGFSRWNGSTGNVTTDSTQRYRGDASFRCIIDTDSGAALLFNDALTFPRTEFWMRTYLYLTATPPREVAILRARLPDDTSLDLRIRPGGYTTVNTRLPASWQEASATIPVERWFCIVWHVKIGTVGLSEVAIDGTRMGFGSTMDTTPPPGTMAYAEVVAGLNATYSFADDYVAFFDDLMFDSKVLTCDQ
jgi:hypothetical protein